MGAKEDEKVRKRPNIEYCGSAPRSNKAEMASAWPSLAAQCNGVVGDELSLTSIP